MQTRTARAESKAEGKQKQQKLRDSSIRVVK